MRCFYLFNLVTYNLIRSSGFLQLPHKLTLSKYTGFASTGSSFNRDIIKKLIDESNITEAKEYEKNVMLLFDEMKVKAGLIFSCSTGKLIGFVDLGKFSTSDFFFFFALYFLKHVKYVSSHVVIGTLYSAAQTRVGTDCIVALWCSGYHYCTTSFDKA